MDSKAFLICVVALSALSVIPFLGWNGYKRWNLKLELEIVKFSEIVKFYGPLDKKAEKSMTDLLEMLIPDPGTSSQPSKTLRKYGGRDISTAFFHIMRMGYNTRKKAAKRVNDSIGKNEDDLLWMKTNLHKDVSSFILLNCERSFIDKHLSFLHADINTDGD